MVAISALTCDGVDPEILQAVEDVYARATAPLVFRTRAQIEQLFDGLDLVEPVHDVYRSTESAVLGGIGIKR